MRGRFTSMGVRIKNRTGWRALASELNNRDALLITIR
jgi:hypothetical protein